MIVSRVSPLTGATNTMNLNVTEDQLALLEGPKRQRPLIQDIFPSLTPAEREFLLTGYTQEDWDLMFADEDDLK